MSFIYGTAEQENVVPKTSSNAYANGADQNCGNVITDRPTTRLHAPPGGHSQICFGADPDPVPVRQTRVEAQDATMNSNSNVNSQVFGAPSSARAQSSNAYANGTDQNCGNFITDRPTTRLHAPPGGRSQISFGGDDDYSAPVVSRPNTAAAAAKEREQTGSDIFGATPAPQQQQQHHQDDERELVAPEAPPASHREASATDIQSMMIAELRILCREHGVSPAGAKPTLVTRLCEAMETGQIKIMVANKGASGMSNSGGMNNYGRAEGQNVGNFMTGRNSSRVLAPPGGGSSFSIGGYGNDSAPAPNANMSDAKALEISGHDIFSDEAAASRAHVQMSETKAAHLQGHDVFADEPNAFVPGKAQSEAKMKRDMYANNVFSDAAEPHRPSTAQSRAKAEEISGHDIFSNGDGFKTGDMSESRTARHAAMGGSDVFSNETGETRRIVGGVSKPPGGESNIVF